LRSSCARQAALQQTWLHTAHPLQLVPAAAVAAAITAAVQQIAAAGGWVHLLSQRRLRLGRAQDLHLVWVVGVGALGIQVPT
jgi:predicted lipid carrier protein YhbT